LHHHSHCINKKIEAPLIINLKTLRVKRHCHYKD